MCWRTLGFWESSPLIKRWIVWRVSCIIKGKGNVTFDHVRFAYPTTPGAVIAIYIVLDNIVSSFAVYRWSERVDNVPASNSFWEYVDERFPDERMERIYENMVFD